jgi:glycosyltransferase involved in cell wall biosynthesis
MIDELSIVIPTLNEEKYLPLLLNSLLAQNFYGKMQVIVVDGNSTDRTVQIATKYKGKFTDFSIINSRKRRVGYQRNRGAEKAKHKYLLFLDADMILPRGFLHRFLKEVDPNKNFIDTANVWLAERDFASGLAFLFFNPLIITIVALDKIIPGFFIFIKKETHIKIQGFREDLKVGEDIDYGRRAMQNGAIFRFHFLTYALHSARRIQRVGAPRFFYDYLRGYVLFKKFGIEKAGQEMKHTYKDFLTRA